MEAYRDILTHFGMRDLLDHTQRVIFGKLPASEDHGPGWEFYARHKGDELTLKLFETQRPNEPPHLAMDIAPTVRGRTPTPPLLDYQLRPGKPARIGSSFSHLFEPVSQEHAKLLEPQFRQIALELLEKVGSHDQLHQDERAALMSLVSRAKASLNPG